MVDQQRFSSMNGTIKSLNTASGSGFITAADGLMVSFLPSAVLDYDVPTLAIGQMVTFDLEPGRHPKALNVYVQRAGNAEGKRLEITRLRYIGFEHRGRVRIYRFERYLPGEAKRTFTVDVDLALFTKHHVGIQEGPALCLHLLEAEQHLADEAGRTVSQCSLTDREMLAYLASRPVPRPKHGFKHAQPAPDVTSHVV
jgi:cold shock CspA family protein